MDLSEKGKDSGRAKSVHAKTGEIRDCGIAGKLSGCLIQFVLHELFSFTELNTERRKMPLE
jgi:hypothetical protein